MGRKNLVSVNEGRTTCAEKKKAERSKLFGRLESRLRQSDTCWQIRTKLSEMHNKCEQHLLEVVTSDCAHTLKCSTNKEVQTKNQCQQNGKGRKMKCLKRSRSGKAWPWIMMNQFKHLEDYAETRACADLTPEEIDREWKHIVGEIKHIHGQRQ